MNKFIDHTLLKADASKDQILKLCQEAKQFDFASVCVNPAWIETCVDELKGTKVMVCTVIGFPLGASTTSVKAFETKDAINKGASEIDMVLNISQLKDKNDEYVYNDIKAVVEAANGKCVKVIFETCLLSEEEIIRACHLCVKAKATFVKTSTGFSTRGAIIEDVLIMKKAVNGACKVKAAGGVRTFEDMELMIKAGADRIGTSAGVKLMQREKTNSSY